MNEQEALALMIPPGRIRPGKMGGGGVVQILLTRACTLSCFNCTQGSNLAGKPTFMSLANFEQAVVSLKGYFGLVALFGGQPTLHPQFTEICSILARHVPIKKRGLWTNALNGHGAVCRQTFWPRNCNLNVHLDQEAHDEFKRDWPESMPFGLHDDSRHSPVHGSMIDLGVPESERWERISRCDINQHWSPLVGEFRGEDRAWFCEVAAAQAMLNQHKPDYPDTGVPVEPGWWRRPMADFAHQVRQHCHNCLVPMRGHGELSQAMDGIEQTTESYRDVFKPKRPGRNIQFVSSPAGLGVPLVRMTNYMQNAKV